MSNALQKIVNLWNKYAKVIKTVFVASVIVFVVIALSNFFKDVHWAQVGVDLQDQSVSNILIMTICGLIAVLPMLGYDLAITKLLPGHFSKLYIFRSGWITNTLTNIAGFGGLLGATLRAYFYGKKASRNEILLAIAKIAVFLLAGLSILCWLALFVMYGFHDGGHFNRYTIWLIGGGCYFPIVFFFTRRHDSKLFQGLTPQIKTLLTFSSTLEWLFVALFFILIGGLMDVHINLMTVFPLYVVAQVLGVVSMLPGAIGSFDVMMMFELTVLGVPRATTIVWLLLFRVFYYIVPIIIGAIFFVHHLFSQLDEFFDHIPLSIARQTAHWLITCFMYISGILMLLAASVPDLTDNNRLLQRFYPFTFFFLHQLTTIIFAIAMLACARGLESKVKRAYWPTVIVLVIGITNTIINLGTVSLTIFLFIILILVFLMRHVPYREKLQYSTGKFIVDSIIFVGSLILYIIVGIINTPHYAANHSIPQFLLFPGEKIWLSGFLGLILGFVIMFLILRYLMGGKDPFTGQQPLDKPRVTAIIKEFGGNETSHLAMLCDKNIYYYTTDHHDQLFFMYRRKNDKLIIMGDPVGNQAMKVPAIRQFLREADCYGYQLVFYEVNSSTTLDLHEFGFDFIKTGEDGWVKLADFTLAGKKQRSQRALMHKFDREGYTFEIVQPPFTDQLMQELKVVSDNWLGNEVEKGFSLGFFSPQYINEAPVALVRSANGQLVAFATLMPTGSKKLLTIDLMRHRRDAPSGIMDKIFVSMFQYGQDNGYEFFDLGMAPLSNVGASQYSFIEEKVAHFIYEYGYHLYGFQGLRHYKDKYASCWFPKYTVFRKKSSLIDSMLALLSVVNQRIDEPRRRFSWIVWWK
ncbi:bifunctional lysylphosphatidylglycerol flippase/synthetase MprF [uncultured Limosilactobacillus sp.]|uniref:bifunctional lysylphosphatidylglycerol flippase/synthetase MprF n=1 Tax=uncultured Limosilactobacillus sp. TaxID=2837629 RepID=UPI0025F40DD2|nr:bifunctional lysylphosphatidylglycerol flippase/synthetase MprF [uncultured Limosilactobacillus sp.]